jgi:hypothetical protein
MSERPPSSSERDAIRHAIFQSLSWRDRSDRPTEGPGCQLVPAASTRLTGDLQLIGPAHEMQGLKDLERHLVLQPRLHLQRSKGLPFWLDRTIEEEEEGN